MFKRYSNQMGCVAKDNTMYYLDLDNLTEEYLIRQRLTVGIETIFDVRSPDKKNMEMLMKTFRDIHNVAYLSGVNSVSAKQN